LLSHHNLCKNCHATTMPNNNPTSRELAQLLDRDEAKDILFLLCIVIARGVVDALSHPMMNRFIQMNFSRTATTLPMEHSTAWRLSLELGIRCAFAASTVQATVAPESMNIAMTSMWFGSGCATQARWWCWGKESWELQRSDATAKALHMVSCLLDAVFQRSKIVIVQFAAQAPQQILFGKPQEIERIALLASGQAWTVHFTIVVRQHHQSISMHRKKSLHALKVVPLRGPASFIAKVRSNGARPIFRSVNRSSWTMPWNDERNELTMRQERAARLHAICA